MKELKYQQLQSSVFGGGYVENQPITYNQAAGRAVCSSNANWNNKAIQTRPNNGPTAPKEDPFIQRQKELASSQIPLPQTENLQSVPSR